MGGSTGTRGWFPAILGPLSSESAPRVTTATYLWTVGPTMASNRQYCVTVRGSPVLPLLSPPCPRPCALFRFCCVPRPGPLHFVPHSSRVSLLLIVFRRIGPAAGCHPRDPLLVSGSPRWRGSSILSTNKMHYSAPRRPPEVILGSMRP